MEAWPPRIHDEPALEPDWKISLRAHSLPAQVLIAGLAVLFAVVLLQVSFLILGALILSGTIASAVLKTVFALRPSRKSEKGIEHFIPELAEYGSGQLRVKAAFGPAKSRRWRGLDPKPSGRNGALAIPG